MGIKCDNGHVIVRAVISFVKEAGGGRAEFDEGERGERWAGWMTMMSRRPNIHWLAVRWCQLQNEASEKTVESVACRD